MVANQANLFLIFTINGILIGLLFDIFRVLRKSFKTPDIITYIEDFFFWLITGFILLYSIFTFSNGEVRFYMFIAIFLGCLIYMIVFSKAVIHINVSIIKFVIKILNIIIKIFAIPVNALINILQKISLKPIHFITINIKKTHIYRNKKLKTHNT